MKRFVFSGFLSLIIIGCFGQTQGDLNYGAQNNFEKADKELNMVYQNILEQYKSDTMFIKNIRNAQKIWIQFRDSEMKAKYPNRKAGYYGSVQPMCWSMYLTELTQERTKKLKIWLVGIKEGDTCSGSVKIK